MRRYVVCLFPLILLASCSLFSTVIKKYEDMTPQQKVTWMMDVYLAEYHKYEAATANPATLTESEKVVLRVKLKALKKAYPLIHVYATMVKSGTFSAEVELAAFAALQEFLKY